MPSPLASILTPEELESMRQRLQQLPEPPDRAHISRGDWWGALGVFLLVFLSTFPVAIPFMFVERVSLAMRISNAIAILMLFITGMAYGRAVGRSPWVFGISMVMLGAILAAITIALGG